MALNPVAYTENIVRSFLRYQLTAYPFSDPRLHAQMRALLSLDETRRSPLLKGPYVSLSRPFREGAAVAALVGEGLLHPHLADRIPAEISHLYSHQEHAIRAIAEGRTTLVSTGTGSGKTECFLYPVVSRCLALRDEGAPSGISAVIVYPMNALAEDQLMRLRGLLAGTGIPFGIYVGKTPEREVDVAGVRLPPGSSRADYEARLARARRDGSGETVYPAEEVCSREVMRTAGRQPRILLTNVKQLELLLTRQQDIELFSDARLDFLVFDEAHTFTGALGAETACLIRRLRASCNAEVGHTICVATSATIVDRRDPGTARDFASRFFGVAPDSVATVGEDYEAEVWTAAPRVVPPPPAEDPATILDRCVEAVEDEDVAGVGVRAAYRALSGEELGEGDWPEALHAALSRNEVVFRLNEELRSPRSLDELPEVIESGAERPVTEAEVLAWLTLGAAARRDGRPLLRPVVHGFVRGIGGAVVSFPEDADGARLWLAAEDEAPPGDAGDRRAHFPVTTCTTCGQHYYVSFLEDFEFTGRRPGGGRVGSDGSWWEPLERTSGGCRVVLFDRLIGSGDDDDEDESPRHPRTAPLHFCRQCGAAHPGAVSRCLSCGTQGDTVVLHAVRQSASNQRPGMLSSCLSCGATGHRSGAHYREPARAVRAINVSDVHVLTQDMVHHAERRRLLVFCDNRQDAAFQAGWMKDHARRFRLRALMAEGIKPRPCAVGDLVAWLDDRLEADETLSRALLPEVWQVARREGAGGRHAQERRKYLRFQVLREVALSSRQALGLEPWGRMKVEYEGLDTSLPWIQDHAHQLGISAERLREGVAGVLDYLRRKRVLHDPEHEIFTKYWMEGDREIQQGYLPSFLAPNGTKLRREATEKPSQVTQWLSAAGDTTMRQVARRWGVSAEETEPFLGSLFDWLVDQGLLVSVRLKGSKGRPLPNVEGVYQVNGDRLRLSPNRGVRRCRSCRRTTIRDLPHDRCLAWRCDGVLDWVREDEDNYDLNLLDGAYSMLRPEEHTAMVPQGERERLENLFKGASDAVNCLVCTPTLELGIDIGQLDSVLMRNVPPLPANYWQRAGRAGRRHRMAVDITYCRSVSHDRAYFAEPLKLLGGRIDPPAFNLRNESMVAKHVHAAIIASLHRYGRDAGRPEVERDEIREVLALCLPPRVAPYLFDGEEVRAAPFDLSPLRELVRRNSEDLTTVVSRVFRQGWPEADAAVTEPAALRAHVETFADNLESVVVRLRRRLRWALDQIRRLNRRRESQGTLDPEHGRLADPGDRPRRPRRRGRVAVGSDGGRLGAPRPDLRTIPGSRAGGAGGGRRLPRGLRHFLHRLPPDFPQCLLPSVPGASRRPRTLRRVGAAPFIRSRHSATSAGCRPRAARRAGQRRGSQAPPPVAFGRIRRRGAGEQVRLDRSLGTTTPDVIYRAADHDPDEGVCIYLDGLSEHLHGNPETAERDRAIRTWLRNRGYEVIEIAANELSDEDAMVRHFRRLASYLGMAELKSRVREDRSWFRGRAGTEAKPARPRLRLVTPPATARYVTCAPLVPLKAAAGAFSDPQSVPDESDWEWVEVDTARSLRPGMFVAQVVGKSMEPRIPDGAYCLFASPVAGTRQGRTVLVQLHDAVDPDTGDRFTVKQYRSEKAADENGWRHVRIVLEPLNPDFEPFDLMAEDEDSVAVVAELVEVIGTDPLT